MFEKEAEEWRNSLNYEIDNDTFNNIVIPSIEFGYNKANEWHYVKDGINPTHSYRVLVFTDEGVGFGIYGLDDKKWHTYDTGFDVIAWKEIVLPKESE